MENRRRAAFSGVHGILFSVGIRANRLERYKVKCKLVRLLHAHDWDPTLIRQFFLVIDWMMALPPELASKLSDFITDFEEEQKMEYVSSVERIKIEQANLQGKLEGILEGKLEGIEAGSLEASCAMLCRLLTRRFGELPQTAHERIKTADRVQIDAWFDRAIDAQTLDEVFQDVAH